MKYIDIYKSLKSDIISGRYKPDSKMPSALELRSIFKVSLRTIQHSLNLLKTEGLVKGVRSQGIFVRNTHDLPANTRRKSSGQIEKVGVLYPRYSMHTIWSPYFYHMFWGIQNLLVREKIRCYLIETKDKTIQELFREINALQIGGLICLELENEILQKELEQLRIPLVHVELTSFKSSTPLVAANHFQGGELAVRHLHKLGHGKILFLYARKKNDPIMGPTTKMRWQGVQSEAKKNKISAVKEFVLHQAPGEGLRRSLNTVLNTHAECTGIIITTDYMLRELKSMLESEVTGSGPQLDFVSFDEEIQVPEIRGRPVQFCLWDKGLMGAKAVETLLAWNSKPPRKQYLPMFLKGSVKS